MLIRNLLEKLARGVVSFDGSSSYSGMFTDVLRTSEEKKHC